MSIRYILVDDSSPVFGVASIDGSSAGDPSGSVSVKVSVRVSSMALEFSVVSVVVFVSFVVTVFDFLLFVEEPESSESSEESERFALLGVCLSALLGVTGFAGSVVPG